MIKVDKKLSNVYALANKPKQVECFIYVNDINFAKKEINKIGQCKIVSEFPFINALYLNFCISKLPEIAKSNFVKYVSSQSNVTTLVDVSKNILFENTTFDLKGEDVTVCFIDTGLHPHLDFTLGKNRIVGFLDLVNGKKRCYDDNGHGTFVCGICCGNGLVSAGRYAGIAPKTNIFAIKALDSKGEANATNILQAMQWVYDNCKRYNITTVCMSFGSEPLGINDPIMKGAEALWNKNVCVVAAAGNSGPNFESIKSPGISPKIITVGGMDDNREGNYYSKNFFEVADFSSRGPSLRRPKPDLVAPSVDITSCSNKQFYNKLSGTSVATPMIAGMSALIHQKNKKLKPDAIKKLLLSSCTGITYNRNIEGYGYPSLKKIFRYLSSL